MKISKERHKNVLNLLLIAIFGCACNDTINDEVYHEFSKKNIGINEYQTIYALMKDSLLSWNNSGIIKWKENPKESKTILDSLICFNKKKDKVIGALLSESFISKSSMDAVGYFNGVKIKNKWYFFDGAAIHLPRENYQKDIHTPLSFEKLHELAMKHVFAGYLKHNNWFSRLFSGNEEYEINEGFFRDLSSGAWCSTCKTQEEWDKAYMEVVNDNWKRRDTTFNKKENS